MKYRKTFEKYYYCGLVVMHSLGMLVPLVDKLWVTEVRDYGSR